MERIPGPILKRIEHKLTTSKWMGDLVVGLHSDTFRVVSEKQGVKIEFLNFDLEIKNPNGKKVANLHFSLYLKPMQVVKLDWIRVDPDFRNKPEHYGKTIMRNFQKFIGSTIAVLKDETREIWDDKESGLKLRQPYLKYFYRDLGWKKLFSVSNSESETKKKYFSNRAVSRKEIDDLRRYIRMKII